MIYARRKRLYRAYRVTARYTHIGTTAGYFGNSYDNEREYSFPNSSRSRPEQFERTALLTKATNYIVWGFVYDRNNLK
jgi:hypothetical protein